MQAVSSGLLPSPLNHRAWRLAAVVPPAGSTARAQSERPSSPPPGMPSTPAAHSLTAAQPYKTALGARARARPLTGQRSRLRSTAPWGKAILGCGGTHTHRTGPRWRASADPNPYKRARHKKTYKEEAWQSSVSKCPPAAAARYAVGRRGALGVRSLHKHIHSLAGGAVSGRRRLRGSRAPKLPAAPIRRGRRPRVLGQSRLLCCSPSRRWLPQRLLRGVGGNRRVRVHGQRLQQGKCSQSSISSPGAQLASYGMQAMGAMQKAAMQAARAVLPLQERGPAAQLACCAPLAGWSAACASGCCAEGPAAPAAGCCCCC